MIKQKEFEKFEKVIKETSTSKKDFHLLKAMLVYYAYVKKDDTMLDQMVSEYKKSYPELAYEAAIAYLQRDIKEDTIKGFDLLTYAYDQKVTKAYIVFAQFYTSGTSPAEKNKLKAIEIYRNGAKLNDQFCQLQLGKKYLYGTDIKKDIKKAKYWLEKSSKQNNAEAYYMLSLLFALYDKNEIKADKYLLIVADLNSPNTLRDIGQKFFKKNEFDKAIKYTLKIIDIFPKEMAHLGYYYYRQNKDINSAQSWLKRYIKKYPEDGYLPYITLAEIELSMTGKTPNFKMVDQYLDKALKFDPTKQAYIERRKIVEKDKYSKHLKDRMLIRIINGNIQKSTKNIKNLKITSKVENTKFQSWYIYFTFLKDNIFFYGKMSVYKDNIGAWDFENIRTSNRPEDLANTNW